MFAELFIKRPKFAVVLSVLTVLLGGICLMRMPIAEYPEIAPPTVKVTATYPGATAFVVANTVATVLEEQVNGIEDMQYFSSSSDNSGNYSMTLTFRPGTNSDIATVNVQNAVQSAITSLPEAVQMIGVVTKKQSTDMVGVYSFMSKDSSKLDLLQLANYVRMNIKDPLARLPGMGFVEVLGERNYSMRIWLDPVKMAALNLSPTAVAAKIRSQNLAAAAGAIGTELANDHMQIKLDITGRLDTAQQFEDIILATDANGTELRLKDIARVELGAERYGDAGTFTGLFNDKRIEQVEVVSLALYRQDGANAIDLIDSVNRALAEMAPRFPEELEFTCAYDPTEYIRQNVAEIASTLILTLILVVVITWVFLQDWRATLVPTIAIPVSLLGTFFVMTLLDYSINVLTMFGMILVIGSLVDNAIVVVENTMRLIEQEQLDPKAATAKSMRQVTSPVIAATLVSVAIYAPIGFYPGIVGTIYKQFAVTMCVGLLISAFNALTLSPALCSLLLRPSAGPSRLPHYRLFNWLLDCTRGGYAAIARLLVRTSLFTVIPLAVVVWLNWHCLQSLRGGFLPAEDKGCVMVDLELPPGASIARNRHAMDELTQRLSTIPGIHNVLGISGFSFLSGLGENIGACIIKLDHWNDRTTPETQIEAIKAKAIAICQELPHGIVRVFQPPAIMGLGVSGGVTFAFRTTGNDTPHQFEQQLGKLLGFLNDKQAMPDVMYAFSSFSAQNPQVFIDVDRQKAEALHVPFDAIANALSGNLAAEYINDFNKNGYAFKVKIQVDAPDRADLQNIEDLQVQNTLGQMVPFSAFATFRTELGARRIERFTQNMSAAVTVIPFPGASSAAIMDAIERHLVSEFPKQYDLSWTDMSFQEKNNQGQIAYLMALAVIFGYLFLVAQYESWTMPLPVMLSVLFATLGGLGALSLTGINLDVYAQLGLIMLIGLCSKSTILMVEFAMQARAEGNSILDAAVNSIHFRLRAVLMTALSFVIGVLPMLFASGAGAESRRVIGVTTFWGMLVATVIGVAFVPPMYVTFQKLREFLKGLGKR